MMNLKRPVPVFFITNHDGNADSTDYMLTAFRAFIRSHLRSDTGSYRNAAAYIEGKREKEVLITLSSEKYADLEALDPDISGPSPFSSRYDAYEPPSFTQYIIDANFDPILDMISVFHFAYQRELKTLELFDRLEQSTKEHAVKILLNKVVMLQRESILRLDAKLAALCRDGIVLNEIVETEFSQALV
jgi:hypothetical protein